MKNRLGESHLNNNIGCVELIARWVLAASVVGTGAVNIGSCVLERSKDVVDAVSSALADTEQEES